MYNLKHGDIFTIVSVNCILSDLMFMCSPMYCISYSNQWAWSRKFGWFENFL